MNLSAPFIRRPVATTLLTAAVALAGAVAFRFLPVSPLPQVDFPTISVSAGLPGASPEIMASSVAAPLERQLGHIAGVNEMTSASYLGTTSITLQFDLNRNIDGAARDVQAAINAARAYLPSNLPSNPTYRKVNPADAPILILALTSPVYDRGRLYDAHCPAPQSPLRACGQYCVRSPESTPVPDHNRASLPEGCRTDIESGPLTDPALHLRPIRRQTCHDQRKSTQT